MKTSERLTLSTALVFSLSACWEGDPKIGVSEPVSTFFASSTVQEFQECDFQDRDKLSRTERAFILHSADCTDGQCLVSGRGYPTKEEPFHIARLSDSGSCTLEEVKQVQFKETFSVEVTMNRDYLRSLDLSSSEVEALGHHNFAGSRYGDLRGTLIDEINHDVTVTIFYEELPEMDEFIVSAKTVSFSLKTASGVPEN